MTNYENDCEIVFGGDCFDQFTYDFNDHSSNTSYNLTEYWN